MHEYVVTSDTICNDYTLKPTRSVNMNSLEESLNSLWELFRAAGLIKKKIIKKTEEGGFVKSSISSLQAVLFLHLLSCWSVSRLSQRDSITSAGSVFVFFCISDTFRICWDILWWTRSHIQRLQNMLYSYYIFPYEIHWENCAIRPRIFVPSSSIFITLEWLFSLVYSRNLSLSNICCKL